MKMRLRSIVPALFLLLIVGEQSFLFLVGNRLSEHQDAVFRAYIDALGEPADGQGIVGAEAFECKWAPVALIYRFKMCVRWCRSDSDEGCFILRVQHPAGFLTLIPRDYPDRIVFDGVNILMFDRSGRTLTDFRDK